MGRKCVQIWLELEAMSTVEFLLCMLNFLGILFLDSLFRIFSEAFGPRLSQRHRNVCLYFETAFWKSLLQVIWKVLETNVVLIIPMFPLCTLNFQNESKLFYRFVDTKVLCSYIQFEATGP